MFESYPRRGFVDALSRSLAAKRRIRRCPWDGAGSARNVSEPMIRGRPAVWISIFNSRTIAPLVNSGEPKTML
jgi:hypothetical protein